MRLAGALVGGKEGGACRLLGEEALDIVGADLIGLLRDGRADHRDNALRLGAELCHGLDRRLDDARQRAAPAGMGRADDARLRRRRTEPARNRR